MGAVYMGYDPLLDWVLWGAILVGLPLVGMVVITSLWLIFPFFYGRPYLGPWLMLAGLALVLAGVVIRAVPVLRATQESVAL